MRLFTVDARLASIVETDIRRAMDAIPSVEEYQTPRREWMLDETKPGEVCSVVVFRPNDSLPDLVRAIIGAWKQNRAPVAAPERKTA